MSDTIEPGIIGKEFRGGLDIDGAGYTVIATVGEAYSAGSDTLHDVTITVPGLWAPGVDRVLRAISSDYEQSVSVEVG
jgi:hypothetical protein